MYVNTSVQQRARLFSNKYDGMVNLLALTQPKTSNLRLGCSSFHSTGTIFTNWTSSSVSGNRTFCSEVSSDGPANN